MEQPTNKGKKFPAETLTPTEVEMLISVCSTRAPTGIRNSALITCVYRTGLRISEALALYPKDLNLVHGTAVVLHGKGDKRRMVGLDPASIEAIRERMDVRARYGLTLRQPLFCTLKGKRIDSSYIRRLLPRLARRAGIEKRVHAHGLRHTLASELAAECVPLPTVMHALGHSSLAITNRYIHHLMPGEVIDAMQKRDWSRTTRRRRKRKKEGREPE